VGNNNTLPTLHYYKNIMDSKVNYAIVGFFVITLGIALVATILWLSVGLEKKNYQTYQVYIQESVSGLNPKAPVKYRGVEVGYVRDIALVVERPHEVRVLLDIEQAVPIKQDTHAILSIQGLTGLAHIELTGGSLEASPPVRESGQQYPEIKTKPSLMVRLDTAMSAFLKQLNQLSDTTSTFFNRLDPNLTNNLLANLSNLSRAMNAFLSEKNHTAVTNILHNIEIVSGTVAARADSIDMVLSNSVQSTENLNQMTKKVNGILSQLGNSLVALESSFQAFTNIANAVENTSEAFNDTTKRVNNVVESIDKTTGVIGQTAQDISVAVIESRRDMDYFTRQALPEVTNSLRELQVLLTSLRNFAQELERKPNMLLFGKSKVPTGPGE
jgi:phospholipid/cholesterol/gamma-HCH transport system substrate-binding protein